MSEDMSRELFLTRQKTSHCAPASISACVFIVVGNISTIILMAANIILRRRTMFLVINMAFADLMLGTMSARILSVYSSDLAGYSY